MDRRAGGEAGHDFDVERRLTGLGGGTGPTVHQGVGDRHIRSVAGLVGGDIRRGVVLELEDPDGLAGPQATGGVERL